MFAEVCDVYHSTIFLFCNYTSKDPKIIQPKINRRLGKELFYHVETGVRKDSELEVDYGTYVILNRKPMNHQETSLLFIKL